MPWDPKPNQQSPAPASAAPSSTANGLPPSSYSNYDTPSSTTSTNGARIKQEPGTEPQYNGLQNGYPQPSGPTQGGLARAQQLVQQQYGHAANASINAMQRGGGGLALPGQQQAKPQGLHLPPHSPQQGQQQYSPQQQQAMRQQQQQLAQQQAQPRIKVENDSPHMAQGSFPQQTAQPNYSQTDGADDAYEQWQEFVAQRRAVSSEQIQKADGMMRDRLMQMSAEMQNGLMVPLDQQPSSKRLKRKAPATAASTQTLSSSSAPAIPQLDGDVDEDEEKPDIKDEDDENAINSDLDDSDDDGQGQMGDDDDEFGDTILCTYDKVQRVKNKWKCTLKDGIMSVNGKEWVFHKGMGEFEW